MKSNIVVFVHNLHRDFPWSVGRVRRLLTLPATDDNYELAESIVDRIRERAGQGKRLRAYWRLSV